jgi:hypothetical protein
VVVVTSQDSCVCVCVFADALEYDRACCIIMYSLYLSRVIRLERWRARRELQGLAGLARAAPVAAVVEAEEWPASASRRSYACSRSDGKRGDCCAWWSLVTPLRRRVTCSAGVRVSTRRWSVLPFTNALHVAFESRSAPTSYIRYDSKPVGDVRVKEYPIIRIYAIGGRSTANA